MPRCIAQFAMTALCAAALVCAVPTAVRADSSLAEPLDTLVPISIEPEFVDLGEVDPGVSACAIVVATNTGLSPLRVGRISASCGCTSVSASDDVVQPSESIEFSIKMSAPSQSGRSRRVRVLVQFRGENAHLIEINAVVQAGNVIESSLDGVAIRDSALVGNLHLRSVDGRVFQVEPSSELRGLAPDSSTEHLLSLRVPTSETGRIPRRIRVRTSHPFQRLVNVNLVEIISLPLAEDPRGLRFEYAFVDTSVTGPTNGAYLRGRPNQVLIEFFGWSELNAPELIALESEVVDARITDVQFNEESTVVQVDVTPLDPDAHSIQSVLRFEGQDHAAYVTVIGRVENGE